VVKFGGNGSLYIDILIGRLLMTHFVKFCFAYFIFNMYSHCTYKNYNLEKTYRNIIWITYLYYVFRNFGIMLLKGRERASTEQRARELLIDESSDEWPDESSFDFEYCINFDQI
jgi:hypothetical protein